LLQGLQTFSDELEPPYQIDPDVSLTEPIRVIVPVAGSTVIAGEVLTTGGNSVVVAGSVMGVGVEVFSGAGCAPFVVFLLVTPTVEWEIRASEGIRLYLKVGDVEVMVFCAAGAAAEK